MSGKTNARLTYRLELIVEHMQQHDSAKRKQ